MKKKKDEIPILYAYIFRNLNKNKSKILTNDNAMHIMKSIIRRAPRYVYNEILNEMCLMNLLKKINKRKYIFRANKKCLNRLNKLIKEYIFPFSP